MIAGPPDKDARVRLCELSLETVRATGDRGALRMVYRVRGPKLETW